MATIGRCRQCGAEFALVQLLDDWSCRCPQCGAAFANDGPGKACILRNAAAADRLHAELLTALGQITAVPGNLEIKVSPLVTSVLRDVDWQRQLAADVDFTKREIEQVAASVQSWVNGLETRDGNTDATLAGDMRELASRLRQVGSVVVDEHATADTPERSAIRHAAAAIELAASNVETGAATEDELRAAIDQASDAVQAPRL